MGKRHDNNSQSRSAPRQTKFFQATWRVLSQVCGQAPGELVLVKAYPSQLAEVAQFRGYCAAELVPSEIKRHQIGQVS